MANAPIIIKKPRRHKHGHHGGAWKVAYADFVTAMMAFFLVLWIVGQSRDVKAGIAGYFRDPGVLDGGRSAGLLPGSSAGLTSGASPQLVQTVERDAELIDAVELERIAQRLRDMISKLPELDELRDQIQITATPEGLRIELIDSNDATFFELASAQLKPATERILSVIGREVGALKRPIAVEGHTDSRQYATMDGYTNWELSADRANAARRTMERAGLPADLMRSVRGFADKQPTNRADRFAPQNRRVSILVMAIVAPTPAVH